MDYKFYDTSSLLLAGDTIFNTNERFAISSITLNELENIKTSTHKDVELKNSAHNLLKLLNEHQDLYDIQIFKHSYITPIVERDLEITNDTKILACALAYDREIHPDETIFVTNDISLKNIANLFFGRDSIESIEEE